MTTCADHRRAISASADGEPDPVSPAALAAHLSGCVACAAYASELVELDRLVRPAAVVRGPDLTGRVLAAIDELPAPRQVDRRQQLRAFLVLVGVVQLVLAAPAVIGLSTHVARDLAVFELAFAGAILFAAWRPTAALGLFPLAVLLAVGGVATAILDATTGGASIAAEVAHLLPAATVGPLLLLSRAQSRGVGLARRLPT